MNKLIGENVLMRIFIGEGDRYEHRPLYEALVELFRTEGFAGATYCAAFAALAPTAFFTVRDSSIFPPICR
jgi:hypothetical protein